jgi:hypothetical protein
VALRANVSKVRAELLAVRERLKREAADPKALRAIERDLSRAAVHVSLGGSLLPERTAAHVAATRSSAPTITFKSGDTVRVKSSGLLASVLDADDDKLRVQVGSIKLVLRSQDVEPARPPQKQKQKAALPKLPKSSLAVSSLPSAVRTGSNTLDLRGERVDEALAKVDGFLDRLLSSGTFERRRSGLGWRRLHDLLAARLEARAFLGATGLAKVPRGINLQARHEAARPRPSRSSRHRAGLSGLGHLPGLSVASLRARSKAQPSQAHLAVAGSRRHHGFFRADARGACRARRSAAPPLAPCGTEHYASKCS